MTAPLPFIDEHAVKVGAGRVAVWAALIESFGFGASGGGLFSAYARAIGVEPAEVAGRLDEVGSTRVGFRVTEVKPGRLIELSGRHRFSEYTLTWSMSPDETGSSLAATTRAVFPGIHGRAYRALVIDSGAHARVTRRMLGSIAARAARP